MSGWEVISVIFVCRSFAHQAARCPSGPSWLAGSTPSGRPGPGRSGRCGQTVGWSSCWLRGKLCSTAAPPATGTAACAAGRCAGWPGPPRWGWPASGPAASCLRMWPTAAGCCWSRAGSAYLRRFRQREWRLSWPWCILCSRLVLFGIANPNTEEHSSRLRRPVLFCRILLLEHFLFKIELKRNQYTMSELALNH